MIGAATRTGIRALAIVVLSGSLIGCGGAGEPTAGPSSAPSIGPSHTPSEAPSVSPSVTPSTSSAAPSLMPPTVATFTPSGTATATWDLVALGDSNVAGWAVSSPDASDPEAAFPGVYAGLLGQEQGVTVVLHSYYPGNEIRTVARWADVLAVDQSMRADLANANVVILLIGYHDVIPILLFSSCATAWPAIRDCLTTATAPMPAAFDRLYRTIHGLVPADATVLVNDYGIPGPLWERWGAEPFWPELKKAMFDDWRDALEAAATANGFRVVHTYAALNLPTGEPRVDWRSLTSDGWHFNAKGHRLIAELDLAQDGIGPP